ncbi:MAG: diguanylate cyclase [Candidatus Aminicenantes bacterium]|nr:diguanylate cyclase [Candidatus Aminicenantes bacterium]
MGEAFILILSHYPEISKILKETCSPYGKTYISQNLEETISLIQKHNFDVLIVSEPWAYYQRLKGLFKDSTGLIMVGEIDSKLRNIIRQWPHTRMLNYSLYPYKEDEKEDFLRLLINNINYSRLKIEVQTLRDISILQDIRLEEAFKQIEIVKKTVKNSLVSELDKRIAAEKKYLNSKKDFQKIEFILKQLYLANDVTSLVDVVSDIKEIVRAESISFYILDEDGEHPGILKPLVWNETILSHPEYSKHTVTIGQNDFAASALTHGKPINATNLAQDPRFSQRYASQLRFPLYNILCVPIMHDRKPIGVLEVYNKQDSDNNSHKGFNEEDQNLILNLSEHISIAINKLNLIQYDALTSLLRPDPFFEKVIQKLVSENKRHEENLFSALVMGDVDWFKNYNDRNGHEAGNKLLRELANVLKSSIREEDLLCRYGGEEFLFFLSGIKNQQETYLLTDRIRKNVENFYFQQQEFQPFHNLTMSFGISQFTHLRFESLDAINKENLINLVSESDAALSEAKGKKNFAPYSKRDNGLAAPKNRICVFEMMPHEPEKPEVQITTAQAKSPEERRQHKRYPTSTVLIYKKNASSFVTKTVDLSLSGAKIRTEEPLLSNNTYTLTLFLGDKSIHCIGDVIYSRKTGNESPLYEAGIRFEALPLLYQNKLEEYLGDLATLDN